jgi:hypothetical protein
MDRHVCFRANYWLGTSHCRYADNDPKSRTVEVSAMASGGFGSPPEGFSHLTEALTVHEESTITIQYRKGTWCFGAGLCTGPNGANFDNSGFATPLQESIGVLGGTVTNIGALIGAFVPEPLANTPGFQPLDGTLLTSGVGITPNLLFFVGNYNVVQVSGPGTLYLGINDGNVSDNSGSITVTAKAQSSHAD